MIADGSRTSNGSEPTRPFDPTWTARRLEDLGFLASSDLPDRPGPAYLLVALRERPTLRHFDPETVDYWASDGARGTRRSLTRKTPLPLTTDYAWGLIRITDRLHVTNDYLSFGGLLRAGRVDDAAVASFVSPAPILRRGGHSQRLDPGADAVGAWFGRLLLAIDYVPGLESRICRAEPLSRYAAFLSDAIAGFRANAEVRGAHPDLWALLRAEARRVRNENPSAWLEGEGFDAAVRGFGAGRQILVDALKG